MPHSCRTALAATTLISVVVFTWLTSPCRVARAIEPLSANIPEEEVAAEEPIRKAAEAIERIENDEERLRTLSRALYDLRSLGREKLLPLLAAVEREVMRWEDRRSLVGLSEPLAIVDPELLLKLSEPVPDEQGRENCLYYYAGGEARINARKARQVVAGMKNPKRRADALVGILYNGKLELPEVKEVWSEINAIGWPSNLGNPEYAVASALARLQPEQLPQISEFVRKEFNADQAALVLREVSNKLRRQHNEPVAANRAMLAAADLVPKCADPAQATERLLHFGLAAVNQERARVLFDEYMIAKLRKRPDRLQSVAYMVHGGLDYALDNAEHVSAKTGIPLGRLAEGLFAEAASELPPDEVFAWLKAAPASATRETAIAQVPRGLFERTYKTVVDPATHQEWVNSLSKEALNISDPGRLREACEAIFWLTRYPRSKAKITVPQAIKDEYGRLWTMREALPKGNALAWNMTFHFGLHSPQIQVEEIHRSFSAQKTRVAAARLRDSSLEGKSRKEWYDKLLQQARGIPDKDRRAAALSGIATCLEEESPRDAIAVLWEALHLVKPYHKSEPWNHDVGDELGDVLPPSNPDEALSSMYLDFRGGGQPAIDALWEFARKLEAADEREPLLEALGKLLAEEKKFARAAGLTTLLTSPTRQARLWVEIAAEQHGVPYAGRQ